MCRGECGGCVGISLSVEVIVVGVLALSLIPLLRGNCGGVFEFVGIPLSVEVIVIGVLALSFGVLALSLISLV